MGRVMSVVVSLDVRENAKQTPIERTVWLS